MCLWLYITGNQRCVVLMRWVLLIEWSYRWRGVELFTAHYCYLFNSVRMDRSVIGIGFIFQLYGDTLNCDSTLCYTNMTYRMKLLVLILWINVEKSFNCSLMITSVVLHSSSQCLLESGRVCVTQFHFQAALNQESISVFAASIIIICLNHW